VDITRIKTNAIGEINNSEFSYLKTQLLDYLTQAPEFDAAIMAFLSLNIPIVFLSQKKLW
jgi:50S ribosomal protein L16 3-hydroxylase